jgi:hypothetical protein
MYSLFWWFLEKTQPFFTKIPCKFVGKKTTKISMCFLTGKVKNIDTQANFLFQ